MTRAAWNEDPCRSRSAEGTLCNRALGHEGGHTAINLKGHVVCWEDGFLARPHPVESPSQHRWLPKHEPDCPSCEVCHVLRNVEGFSEERIGCGDDHLWEEAVDGAALRAYGMALEKYAPRPVRDAWDAALKALGLSS